VTPPPILLIPIVNKNSSFTTKDFVPIALATQQPEHDGGESRRAVEDAEEFIADAKKNLGVDLRVGRSRHDAPFYRRAGEAQDPYRLTHVPLDSESAAATAVLGGHVNIAFLTLGTTRSHIEAGTLRPLAVASNRRLKDFPNVPTTVEKGFPELNLKVWVGFLSGKNARAGRQAAGRGHQRQS
jgi:tripartite-type tricarboxylate transporter receptor subunit TctC